MHGHPITDSPIPFPELIEAETIQKIDVGFAINGVHQTDFQRIPVDLAVYLGEGWFCWTCKQRIYRGMIVGRHAIKSGLFCMNCMKLSDGIQPDDLLAVKLWLRLKRKSKRHPDGLYPVYFLGTRAQLDAYIHETEGAGYPMERQEPVTEEHP